MSLSRPIKLFPSIFLPKVLQLLLKLASSNLSIIMTVSSGILSVCKAHRKKFVNLMLNFMEKLVVRSKNKLNSKTLSQKL